MPEGQRDLKKVNFIKQKARELRKNMTPEETYLWQRIRRKQLKNLQFYRQKQLGNFIVDFYCPARKLVIEIDGGQHYESGELIERDKAREIYLKKVLKLKVVRFTNIDIKRNMLAVMDRILSEL